MFEKNTERLLAQMLAFIEEGNVIPVIGPELLELEIDGKSRLLYPYLAEQLALRLQIESVAADTLNSVVCRYLAEGGQREDIYPWLIRLTAEMAQLSPPQALCKLAEIRPLKLFVTTSFDPFLAQALNQVRYGGEERARVLDYYPGSKNDLPLALKNLQRSTVFHLFGKVNEAQNFAVTDEDVLEFMHSLQTHARPERLFDALLTHNLLVIGCPLFDWLGRFFVRIVNQERLINARMKVDYLVGDQLQREIDLEGFLRHFSLRTKVLPLFSLEFVDELHRRWLEKHPPQAESVANADESETQLVEEVATETLAAELNLHNGAVFLSYAHEDQPCVMLIRDAFEQAGIEVWFDKNPDALRAGDQFDVKISSNIEQCSLFLPIISQHSLIPKPRYFRKEWKIAQQRALAFPDAMRFIIPVAIDDTPPTAANLDEPIRKLHWERVPGGQCSAAFVSEIKELQRMYRRNNQ